MPFPKIISGGQTGVGGACDEHCFIGAESGIIYLLNHYNSNGCINILSNNR